MSAGHSHDHGAADAAGPGDHRTKLWIAFGITAGIVVAQAIGALLTGSLALLTDTAHALTDASGLLIALIAANLMMLPADPQRTWGFRRIEVIAALGQSTLLLVVGIYAAVEGIKRLFSPPEVPATELLIFGVIGLLANVAAIVVLSSSRGANFNMRAAFLEVLNDTLGSVAVLVSAGVIVVTGWQQADALASLFIAALIVPRTLRLLRETVSVLLETTPPGLDLDDVRRHLLVLPHVLEVHDLHASQITSGLPVLSAHVVVEDSCFSDGHAPQILDQLQACLAEHFPVSVEHSTFQLESPAHASHELAAHD